MNEIDWTEIAITLLIYLGAALLGLGAWLLIIGRRDAERRRYQRLELRACSYAEADQLLRQGILPTGEVWRLAAEEDGNLRLNTVYLERVCRSNAGIQPSERSEDRLE